MTNVCIGEVIGKSLDLEPQYMYMIPACVRVFVHTHESMDIAYIYACVCARSHGAAHARVFTHAPARMCVMRSRCERWLLRVLSKCLNCRTNSNIYDIPFFFHMNGYIVCACVCVSVCESVICWH